MRKFIEKTRIKVSKVQAKCNDFVVNLYYSNYLKVTISVLVLALFVTNITQVVLANSPGGGGLDSTRGEEQFNSLVEFLATWIGRIGGVVAFVGVVQFALGVKSQNPDEKINGLKTLVAGIMVFAVAQAYTFFTNW